MKIVTVPNQALRKKAKPVTTYNNKIKQVIKNLTHSLTTGSERGVGLSAPQIDTQWRIYVTKPEHAMPAATSNAAVLQASKDTNQKVAVFINPKIIKTSKKYDLGEDQDGTPLEGCLSIPGIYGPIPRFHWVEIEFNQVANTTNELTTKTIVLDGFSARLAQHEIDHLDGILFTDYTLEYDLPLYQENQSGALEKIPNTRFIESF